MYALALLMSAGTTAATTGLPYFHLGALDIGIPIQGFGMIVAVGVLIGATPLRRYAEWHGVSDEHIRGLLTWVMVSGFLGAHEFDMIAYNWDGISQAKDLDPASWWFLPRGAWPSNWWLPFRIWDGISSYGGFIGGAMGFALYVWWKRLPARLFADITIVGLLPAFSIGRIGCTVVSDHIGARVDGDHWYSFLAMDYPSEIITHHAGAPGEIIKAWNLGLIEFLYLVPVNLLILWLAFRPSKRMPAGFVTVLTGVLYAPVRFFLDYLRPEDTDPRHLGLTFAQWSSILAFGAALYAASRILKTGAAAETVTPTSREAQERLRVILRDDEASQQKRDTDQKAEAERKLAAIARARAERAREDAEAAELDAAARAKTALAGKADAKVVNASGAGSVDAEGDTELVQSESAAKLLDNTPAALSAAGKAGGKDDAEDKAAAPAGGKVVASNAGGNKSAGNKSGGNKPAGNKSGGNKSGGNKNRKR
jgi:phosphatidylglycerol---prolipoprotein diacylglyceryl transferase